MKPRSQNVKNAMLQRALDTLEVLASAQGRSKSLPEIVEQLGLPKATVHRLLTTLFDRGYVSRAVHQEHGYQLGIRCYELGTSTNRYAGLLSTAAGAMTEINSLTNELVVLAVYDRGEAVYIDTREGKHPVCCESHVGYRAPATCVSTGRVLLAFQSEAEISRVLSQPVPKYTRRTIGSTAALRRLLKTARVNGIAVNHESFRSGVGGVSAAIRDHTGAVVASVGFCLPEYRMAGGRVAWLRGKIQAAAARVSHDLGYIETTATTQGAAAAASSPTNGDAARTDQLSDAGHGAA